PKISRDVAEECVIESGRDGATDCEAVETVGEIDSVGCADNYERKKGDREPRAHVCDDRRFYERHEELARLHLGDGARQKNRADDDGERNLKEQFDATADAVGFFLCNFEIIVNETEHAEIDHGEEREPDEAVVGTRPEKTGNEDRSDNQDAAHGRRSLFSTVQFRETMDLRRLANRLAKLERSQNSDHEVSKQKREKKRRDRTRDGAKRDIKENVEAADLVAEEVKIIKHC